MPEAIAPMLAWLAAWLVLLACGHWAMRILLWRRR